MAEPSREDATPAVEVRQSRWNTRFGIDHFERTLAEQATDGFGLVRIVPLDDYSFIAVFERRLSDSGRSVS